jgi:predicted Zn-dependent protease
MSSQPSAAEVTPEQVFAPDRLEKWVKGEITLREVHALSGPQMGEIAKLAYQWIEQGQYNKARTALEGLISLEPRESYFWSALAALHMTRSDFGYAERCCSYAIALNDKDQAAYVNRAEVAIRRGTLLEAAADLKAAVQLDPEGKNPLTQRARLLAQSVLAASQQAPAGPAKAPAKAGAKSPARASAKPAAKTSAKAASKPSRPSRSGKR